MINIRKKENKKIYKRKRGFFFELKKHKLLYLMMLPTVAFLIINNYMPMLGLSMAFVRYRPNVGLFGSQFVAFENFKYFFSTPDFLNITKNTVLYNLVFIVLDISVATFCAICLNEMRNKIGKKVYQTFMLMPFFLSWVVVNYIFYSFLSVDKGFINNSILKFLGQDAVSWYRETKFWPFILVFAQLWRYTGYNTILIYSGLVAINDSLYEAALMDGAGKLKQIFTITIPMLSPVIIAMFLMLVGRIFYADFGLHFQVTNNSSALYPVTDVLDTYVYRSLRQMGNISMASAAGFYQAIVGMFVVVAANKVVKKVDASKSLF